MISLLYIIICYYRFAPVINHVGHDWSLVWLSWMSWMPLGNLQTSGHSACFGHQRMASSWDVPAPKVPWKLPSGELTCCHGKSPFLIGKPSINGSFSIAFCRFTRGYNKMLAEDHTWCHQIPDYYSPMGKKSSLLPWCVLKLTFLETLLKGTKKKRCPSRFCKFCE